MRTGVTLRPSSAVSEMSSDQETALCIQVFLYVVFKRIYGGTCAKCSCLSEAVNSNQTIVNNFPFVVNSWCKFWSHDGQRKEKLKTEKS